MGSCRGPERSGTHGPFIIRNAAPVFPCLADGCLKAKPLCGNVGRTCKECSSKPGPLFICFCFQCPQIFEMSPLLHMEIRIQWVENEPGLQKTSLVLSRAIHHPFKTLGSCLSWAVRFSEHTIKEIRYCNKN